MPRLLSNLHVTFLSLVDKGANQKEIVWKAAEQPETPTVRRIVDVAKIDEEKRLVYGIVYEPDTEDSHGDQASAEEIEKAAHLFMKEQRTTQVDQQHDQKADEGYVAESWIVRTQDPILPDTKVGAWAVAIKVENDETWELVKSGEIGGISLYGYAEVEEVEKTAVAAAAADDDASLLARLKRVFKRHPKRRSDGAPIAKDFNSEQQASALWNAIDSLHWANWDALYEENATEALRTNVEQFLQFLDAQEAIMKSTTGGSSATLEALEKRLAQLEKQSEADASTDVSIDALDLDPNSTKLLARIEALEKAQTDTPEAAEDEQDPVVADLLGRIDKLEKRSVGRTSQPSDASTQPVQKSHRGISFV